jgi:hypothetical protein
MEPIFDNEQITRRLNELEDLKTKVEKLLSLSKIGEDVRIEIEEVRMLQSKGIIIPHLEKQFADQLYPKRPTDGKKRKPINESEILEAIEKTRSARKAAKFLGVSYPTFKTYAKKYGVHKTKGWPITKSVHIRGPISPHRGKYPIDDILDGKHPEFPVHRLKDKLIRSNIKKAQCEQCEFKERRIIDGKLPLLLNFEDGNNKNHKLENMRLLCYNCTFTSGKGYISKGPKIFDPDILQDSKKILRQRF